MSGGAITASNLLAAGWHRADGPDDCFVLRLDTLLEIRVTCTVLGWKPVVVACGLRSPHATAFTMPELHRLIDETRRANDRRYRGDRGDE